MNKKIYMKISLGEINLKEKKITIIDFFKTHINVIKELMKLSKLTIICIFISTWLLVGLNVVELKFMEYLTNTFASIHLSNFSISKNFLTISIGYVCVVILINLCMWLNQLLSRKFTKNVNLLIEKRLVKKLAHISYDYYENNEFYESINLASQVTSQYHNAVFGLSKLLEIIFTLIAYSIMLSELHWLLPLFIVLITFGNVIISLKTTDMQLNFWRTHVSPMSRRNEYFRNIMGDRINHSNIQNNRTLSYFTKKYDFYNHKEKNTTLKLNKLSFFSELLSTFSFFILMLIMVIWLGSSVVSGKYEIGYFTMVVALLFQLYGTIKGFLLFMLNQNWYVKILTAYYNVLDYKEHIAHNETVQNGIQVSQLKYKYDQSDKYAIKDMSFFAEKGKKIAIVGKNGSGKTTLISIVLGLLVKYQGECKNQNGDIAAVLQDFGNYQMTIKENIELGNKGIEMNESEVESLLNKVGLWDDIQRMPDGMFTKLGQLEHGIELSKGQLQRLAIARLLANKEATVWILDEPTAYLDPIAEIRMYEFILNLAGERLVFFISHRLGFAQNADYIYVIDDGKIVEMGTHTTLINKNTSIYKEMFLSQKKWYQ